MSKAASVTNANFEQEVLKSTGITIVKFGAAWCGPCKKMDPIIDEVITENSKLKVLAVDIDNDFELSAKYGVMSVPTMLFFKDGVLKDSIVGAVPKTKIMEMVNKY